MESALQGSNLSPTAQELHPGILRGQTESIAEEPLDENGASKLRPSPARYYGQVSLVLSTSCLSLKKKLSWGGGSSFCAPYPCYLIHQPNFSGLHRPLNRRCRRGLKGGRFSIPSRSFLYHLNTRRGGELTPSEKADLVHSQPSFEFSVLKHNLPPCHFLEAQSLFIAKGVYI